jgi:hypothetical protein
MLAIFPILMYTVSLTIYKTMVMTVHNQYPDIELVSPIYFCNHGAYYEYPVERTNTDTMMKIDFKFDHDQDALKGISMYEIRRNTRSGHQSNIDTISAEATEDTLKIMRLLVTWKIGRSEKPKVNVVLVECSNDLLLSEDKLVQFYDRVNDIPSCHSASGCTWLMCGDTALAVRREVIRKTGLELKITISQGVRSLNTIRQSGLSQKDKYY